MPLPYHRKQNDCNFHYSMNAMISYQWTPHIILTIGLNKELQQKKICGHKENNKVHNNDNKQYIDPNIIGHECMIYS